MTKLKNITNYLDSFLEVEKYSKLDRKNGLMVKGNNKVDKIVFSTNTTMENIEHANNRNADMLIVHHGGWKETDGEMYEKKVELLKKYNISLYIAHMPLDCNQEVGVAVSLARKLGVDVEDTFAKEQGVIGELSISKQGLKKKLFSISKDYKIVGKLKNVERVAVIGGSGAVKTKWVEEAKNKGCDLYITGNSWFFSDIYAFENNIALVLLGHTNSEKFGIFSLAKNMDNKFEDLEIDVLEETAW